MRRDRWAVKAHSKGTQQALKEHSHCTRTALKLHWKGRAAGQGLDADVDVGLHAAAP